jgi:hypothetical protein
MCLIEVPDKYKTIKKRIVEKAAHTQKKEIPAVYKTVKVKKLVKPATTKKIEIPAQHKKMKVRKEVTAAKEVRTKIPAEYKTVAKTSKVKEGYLAWRPILCETNTTKGVVSELQTKLKKIGYDPGPIDGIYGKLTMAAVKRYQKDKKLAVGGLTMETLKSLNVKI